MCMSTPFIYVSLIVFSYVSLGKQIYTISEIHLDTYDIIRHLKITKKINLILKSKISATETNNGINLRNNIAHCFYLPTEYTPRWMWLLIVAILKLGAFFPSTNKILPND